MSRSRKTYNTPLKNSKGQTIEKFNDDNEYKHLELYLRNIRDTAWDDYRDIVVYIGTDSLNKGSITKFVTVLVVRIFTEGGTGHGAKALYVTNNENRIDNVYLRMENETIYTVHYAEEIIPVLKKLGIKYEIHSDVNSCNKYASYKAKKFVTSWLTAMGYPYKLKPLAYAASYTADHILRNGNDYCMANKQFVGTI